MCTYYPPRWGTPYEVKSIVPGLYFLIMIDTHSQKIEDDHDCIYWPS